MRTPTGRNIRATNITQETVNCSIILRLVRHFVSYKKCAIVFLLCVRVAVCASVSFLLCASVPVPVRV